MGKLLPSIFKVRTFRPSIKENSYEGGYLETGVPEGSEVRCPMAKAWKSGLPRLNFFYENCGKYVQGSHEKI